MWQYVCRVLQPTSIRIASILYDRKFLSIKDNTTSLLNIMCYLWHLRWAEFIAGEESVCTSCASTVKRIHPKPQIMSVNIYCHNASEHLMSQCQWICTITMSVYIYCHNVSVHLVSQCQWISTVTMLLYTWCHNSCYQSAGNYPSINYNFVFQVFEY